ncbi:hypothetical protein [Deinococcus ruber]|uniref:Uncharacterized protein n=1 Tax=Deinococcus ruber TaxID=1848197 RepID=A0A918FFB2_9DEIO|nr:hypothetical protein [Deinococcus ruber]GGR34549.1 hypothetical protein GCM10008957_50800 [Deinococcus ruber]
MMVSIILLSTAIPAESREVWRDAFDAEKPLTWRNYALTRTPKERITWRLSVDARKQYRTRIARLITGGGGVIHPRVKLKKLAGKSVEKPKQEYGEKRREIPRRLSSDAARRQILNLAAHMQHYPGLSGIRSDVFDLAQYCTRVWKSTHPDSAFPLWPKMPILPYLQPRMAPLANIIQESVQEAPEHATQNQSEEVRQYLIE